MSTPHRWAAEIHAWADGAAIEARDAMTFLASMPPQPMPWARCSSPAWDDERFDFRVAPHVRRFRVALLKDGSTTTADTTVDAANLAFGGQFVEWLSDWQEYET